MKRRNKLSNQNDTETLFDFDDEEELSNQLSNVSIHSAATQPTITKVLKIQDFVSKDEPTMQKVDLKSFELIKVIGKVS